MIGVLASCISALIDCAGTGKQLGYEFVGKNDFLVCWSARWSDQCMLLVLLSQRSISSYALCRAAEIDLALATWCGFPGLPVCVGNGIEACW